MAYGIIRVAGVKKTGVAGIQIHDTREKGVSHTNEDIDFERSDLNYDLHNQSPPNFTDTINERIAELDLKRAVRKDANVMAQVFVSATPEWLHDKTAEQQRQYFEDAYEWVCERYGKENVIAATVHMDEATPHMHVNLVPVTEDGRVSYEAHFNERKRGDLTKLQDDFYSHNQGKGYDLERGERQTDESKKQHLDTLDYKVQERAKTVDELEIKRGQLEKEIAPLAKMEVRAEQIKTKDENGKDIHKTSKSMFGGKETVTVPKEDYDKMMSQSKAYRVNRPKIQTLEADQEAVRKRESAADGREHDIFKKAETLAVKEKQVDGMYNTQANLNAIHEQLRREHDALQKKHSDMVKQANEQIKKGNEAVTSLNAQNRTLRDELTEVRQNLTEKLERAYEGFQSAVKGLNMLKYGFNDGTPNPYKAELTPQQGRLIDGITNKASEWAKQDGFPEVADTMKNSMGLSKSIEQAVKALEPKQRSRGLER